MELQSTESPFRLTRALLIGIGVAILALIAAATVALLNEDAAPSQRADAPGTTAPSEPALKQAAWHLDRRIVGPRGGKAKHPVLRLQATAAADVVKQFYDALLVHPEEFDALAKEHVSAQAATALKRSGIATAEQLDRVQTLRRAASVSLQAPAATRAAVNVAIKLRALTGEKHVRLRHLATLWLERAGGRWEVIAFEAEQKRIR
jgi:hypothetical protein